MTNETSVITTKSPIVDLFPTKTDLQMLVKFLDTKGFKTESINVPTFERLVVLLKSFDTHANSSN